MPALLTLLDPAPHPADDTWFAPLLDGTTDAASAVVITRPLGSGPALCLVVHDSDPGATPAPGTEVCPQAVLMRGTADGPARFAAVVEFEGPRTPEWSAAETRASHDRIHPAVAGTPGYVGTVRVVRADGGVVTVSLGETAEALQAAMETIVRTELLPGEDPAMLTGPDRTTFSVVVRAELPVAAATA